MSALGSSSTEGAGVVSIPHALDHVLEAVEQEQHYRERDRDA